MFRRITKIFLRKSRSETPDFIFLGNAFSGEKNNLAEKLPEVRAELSDQLHEWQKEVNANFPERINQINRQ